jgi:putative transposase
MLIVNEPHLRRILTIYLHHFTTTRPPRTLGQLAPLAAETRPPHVINMAGYQVHADRSLRDSPASITSLH